MAFPATGMEAAYRNDGNQVANLFKDKHPGHFCIYNLTERKYDTTMFEGRVRLVQLELCFREPTWAATFHPRYLASSLFLGVL